MTEDTSRVTIRDVYELIDLRLGKLEAKLDRRLDNLDREVDLLGARVDRIEGAVGLIKWIGPAGMAAVALGLLAGLGLIK